MALLPVVAFVASSRLAAARHYPSDVAVGALLGAATGHIVARAFPTMEEGPDMAHGRPLASRGTSAQTTLQSAIQSTPQRVDSCDTISRPRPFSASGGGERTIGARGLPSVTSILSVSPTSSRTMYGWRA
jgi:hypothetical protein